MTPHASKGPGSPCWSAGGGTLLSVVIGVLVRRRRRLYGGWVDTIMSRADDTLPRLPAPALRDFDLRLAAGRSVRADRTSLRIAVLIFVIGFFNWP